jgi:putative hydrolase of the HAD superfamily
VDPSEVVYIGDNPTKDFVGIKPLGFKTVRVLKSPFGSMKVESRYDADIVISDLSKLTERALFA